MVKERPVRNVFGYAILLLMVGSLPVMAGTSAERILRGSLAERGYMTGFDGETDRFVFIGRQVMKTGEYGFDAVFARKRIALARRAELRAKAQLLQALRVRAEGGNRVQTAASDGAGSRRTESTFGLFAGNRLCGWHVLDAVERTERGVYEVAVAVLWSPELEAAGRAAREGRLVPSATWRDECETWLNGQDVSTWTGPRLFRDTAGFPHLFGVGISVLDGNHDLQMKAARMKADMSARGNLLLALFGDAEVRRHAMSRIVSGSAQGDGIDAESVYTALADVEVKGKSVDGMMPVHERVTKCPFSRRKTLVVVYGVKPPDVPAVFPAAADSEKNRGLKIWNPETGRFEKQR